MRAALEVVDWPEPPERQLVLDVPPAHRANRSIEARGCLHSPFEGLCEVCDFGGNLAVGFHLTDFGFNPTLGGRVLHGRGGADGRSRIDPVLNRWRRDQAI